jgi:hypothetical protein
MFLKRRVNQGGCIISISFMYRTNIVKNILDRRIIPGRIAPMIIIKEVYKQNTEEEQRKALIKIIIRLLRGHNQGPF